VARIGAMGLEPGSEEGGRRSGPWRDTRDLGLQSERTWLSEKSGKGCLAGTGRVRHDTLQPDSKPPRPVTLPGGMCCARLAN
jgi:hypothetical protein